MITPVSSNYFQVSQRFKQNTVLSFQAAKEKKEPFIFIAMPMPDRPLEAKQKWSKIHEKIKAVAGEKKVKAQRIDDILLENAQTKDSTFITKSIFKGIANADVVIADLSEENPNVYFELGYAMGKGKKVLPIAKEGTHLPFDVKDIFTIFYSDEDGHLNLSNQLKKMLPAIFKSQEENLHKVHGISHDNQSSITV